MSHYIYKEYEGLIFRITLAENLMTQHVELYRKNVGYTAFNHPAIILMKGYSISEREAKSKITQYILKR